MMLRSDRVAALLPCAVCLSVSIYLTAISMGIYLILPVLQDFLANTCHNILHWFYLQFSDQGENKQVLIKYLLNTDKNEQTNLK